MSEEMLINITPQETRVAVLENGVLQEVFIERSRKRGIVGNIYRGKVSRVLPGMQAAFVDIGLERAAFLHASDIQSDNAPIPNAEEKTDVPPITEIVRDGEELLVQVVKDPLGTKGARLSSFITIPARFLVYMPNTNHVGVSQKIEGDAERQRLIDIVESLRSEVSQGGFILRTAAEGVGEAELKADVIFLERVWNDIQERIHNKHKGQVVHEDLPLSMRAIRDKVGKDIEKIRIDSKEHFQKISKFVKKFIPERLAGIEYYSGPRPIFDLYSVEDEIQKALQSKVQLKSGGHLVIDQTEAMTTIDVNTGAFVGHRNLDETIFKTNLEATQAIARQLRLRNLGGIIIVDFIDMGDDEHKRQVLRALERSLERDHAKTNISEVSSLGLVQMTRKRTRESLEHVLCEPCPVCHGRGTVKTPETICYEIFRELLREARQFEAQQFLVLAAQTVVDIMLDEESASVAELEAFIGKPIKFQVETEYTQELFDVVLM
ncbi:MAG: ribonuclease G [Gammaproteobacteria bacterium]|nr:ribonuclease G [Gammaproteobacteria bacterium]MDH5730800.1 ribonuclease G [Gammaproteobacteria bacterium]